MIYLGVNIKGNKHMRTTCIDVISRLFLSYDISVSQVKNIYEAFESGFTTVQKIYELTDGNIQAVLNEFSKKKNLCVRFAAKVSEWKNRIGEISEEDFDYIYERFGLTYESVLGYPFFSSAKEMANYIKKTIKGQDEAVSELAIPFFQHYVQQVTGNISPINKPVLLCGPTGCGKTEMLTLFSEMTGSPLIIINTSECTATGWRGASINDVIANQAKKYKPDELSRAIMFIDEIDKITHSACNNQIDDLGYDIQRDLMNLTDFRNPVRINIGMDKNFQQNFLELAVNKMLIVFSGAFTGIDKIIEKRLNISSRVGFSTSVVNNYTENKDYKVTARDLAAWGFLDELLGRVGRIVTLKSLDENAMFEILTESRLSILRSQASYSKRVYNATLRFTEGALRMICTKAKKEGLGFRGVQTLLSTCVSSVFYNLSINCNSQYTIEIDESFVNENLKQC